MAKRLDRDIRSLAERMQERRNEAGWRQKMLRHTNVITICLDHNDPFWGTRVLLDNKDITHDVAGFTFELKRLRKINGVATGEELQERVLAPAKLAKEDKRYEYEEQITSPLDQQTGKHQDLLEEMLSTVPIAERQALEALIINAIAEAACRTLLKTLLRRAKLTPRQWQCFMRQALDHRCTETEQRNAYEAKKKIRAACDMEMRECLTH